MRRIALGVLASFVAYAGIATAADDKTAVQTGVAVGQRLPPFTATLLAPSVAEPGAVAFDSSRVDRLTAYVVIGTHCPATQAYAERLSVLERTYAPKQIDFIYVYPNREDTREAKLKFHTEKQLGGRLIDDQGGNVARQLGAQRTSEVVLTDRHGTIVYRGGIDDSREPTAVKQKYLQTAFDETLAGKPVTVTTSPVRA